MSIIRMLAAIVVLIAGMVGYLWLVAKVGTP